MVFDGDWSKGARGGLRKIIVSKGPLFIPQRDVLRYKPDFRDHGLSLIKAAVPHDTKAKTTMGLCQNRRGTKEHHRTSTCFASSLSLNFLITSCSSSRNWILLRNN